MEQISVDIQFSPQDKAAIYARKSLLSENNSIDSQISLAKDKLFEHNLLLHEVYTDEISANSKHFNERPGFSKLLKDASEGLFKTVVVFRRDRLARNVDQFKQIQHIFNVNGIRVIYSNAGEYQVQDDSGGDFIENIIVAMDELEAKIIKQRTSAGKAKKRERGEYTSGGNVPLGYMRLVADDLPNMPEDHKKSFQDGYRFIPQEPQCSFIPILFEKYNLIDTDFTGTVYSKTNLLEDMKNFINQKTHEYNKKLPPNTGRYNPKKDIEYIKKHLMKIIQNPIYAGCMFVKADVALQDIMLETDSPNEFRIDELQLIRCTNVMPILKARATWDNAVIKWRKGYTPQKSSEDEMYLFKGLVQCARCKSNITLIKNTTPYTIKCKCKGKVDKIYYDDLCNSLTDRLIDDILNKSTAEKYIDAKIKELTGEITIKDKEIIEQKTAQQKRILEIAEIVYNDKSQSIVREILLNELLGYISNEKKLIAEKSKLQNKVYNLIDSKKHLVEFPSIHARELIKKHIMDHSELFQKYFITIIEKVIINGAHDGELTVNYGRE